MLVLGVIAPVVPSIVKPTVELYVPPDVPVWVTACALETDVQNGVPPYDIVATGNELIVTEVVAWTVAQPPAAAIVYVTVYVPTVLVLGVIAPVTLFKVKPAVELYVPPEVPVCVTGCVLETDEQNGVPT